MHDRGRLTGWLTRDVAIMAALTLLAYGAVSLYLATQSILAAGLCGFIGFVFAYVVCYIWHEWGHLIGARLSGSHMPLNGYRTPAIGSFDISRHSRRQFLALSWGGVAGYCCAASLCILLYFTLDLPWIGGGLALGACAFVSQSLAVDLPQIVKVHRGADMQSTNTAGASAQVILRRTWQMWTPLFIGVLIYQLTS